MLLYFYRFGAAVPEQGVRQASWIRIPHLSADRGLLRLDFIPV